VKRPLAAVALVVLTWSNATAFQCAAAAAAPPADAPAQAHQHGGHGHDAPAADVGGRDHGDEGSHPGRPDCSVVMSCGAALVARFAHDATRPERLEHMSVTVVATPSTADLSRDPPPPRRSA